MKQKDKTKRIRQSPARIKPFNDSGNVEKPVAHPGPSLATLVPLWGFVLSLALWSAFTPHGFPGPLIRQVLVQKVRAGTFSLKWMKSTGIYYAVLHEYSFSCFFFFHPFSSHCVSVYWLPKVPSLCPLERCVYTVSRRRLEGRANNWHFTAVHLSPRLDAMGSSYRKRFILMSALPIMCTYSSHVCSPLRGQKKVRNLPEMGSQTGMSWHVGARNRTQVLCKSSKCS